MLNWRLVAVRLHMQRQNWLKARDTTDLRQTSGP